MPPPPKGRPRGGSVTKFKKNALPAVPRRGPEAGDLHGSGMNSIGSCPFLKRAQKQNFDKLLFRNKNPLPCGICGPPFSALLFSRVNGDSIYLDFIPFYTVERVGKFCNTRFRASCISHSFTIFPLVINGSIRDFPPIGAF